MDIAFDWFTRKHRFFTGSFHQKNGQNNNIEGVTAEIFKVKCGSSPEIICNIFTPMINNRD